MKRLELLNKYLTEGFSAVEGWVEPDIWPLVAALHILQAELKTNGPALEIGVHYGRFLLGLEQLIEKNDVVVGVDVFESQHLNIDRSGYGSRAVFEANVKKYAAYPDRVIAVSADSLSLNAGELLQVSSNRRFRLISIDGGHTAEHTQSDLKLAEQVLAPAGVVFLDDYYHADWPGVHEGFIRYMCNAPALVPLATFANKMVLCSLSWQQIFLNNLGRAAQMCGKTISAKSVSLFRHPYFNIHRIEDAKQ